MDISISRVGGSKTPLCRRYPKTTLAGAAGAMLLGTSVGMSGCDGSPPAIHSLVVKGRTMYAVPAGEGFYRFPGTEQTVYHIAQDDKFSERGWTQEIKTRDGTLFSVIAGYTSEIPPEALPSLVQRFPGLRDKLVKRSPVDISLSPRPPFVKSNWQFQEEYEYKANAEDNRYAIEKTLMAQVTPRIEAYVQQHAKQPDKLRDSVVMTAVLHGYTTPDGKRVPSFVKDLPPGVRFNLNRLFLTKIQ